MGALRVTDQSGGGNLLLVSLVAPPTWHTNTHLNRMTYEAALCANCHRLRGMVNPEWWEERRPQET